MSKFGVFLIIVCVAFVVTLPRGWANRWASFMEIKPYDQVIADCTQTLEADPDNQSACEKCGIAYIEKGDKAGNFTEAKAAYEKAAEFYSRLMAINQSAKAYYGRGRAYHRLGNRALDSAEAKTAYDRALADYGKSIELNNQDEQAWDRREEIYMETGEYSKAIASYTSHLAVQPGAYNEYYRRGYAYDLIGEYAKALADYDKVIKLDQGYFLHFAAYEKRGQLYMRLKKYEEAIADFTQAVNQMEIRARVGVSFSGETEPLETDKLKCAEAHYLRAGAYYAKGEYAKAFSDCVRALKLYPDYTEARVMKGKLFEMLSKQIR